MEIRCSCGNVMHLPESMSSKVARCTMCLATLEVDGAPELPAQAPASTPEPSPASPVSAAFRSGELAFRDSADASDEGPAKPRSVMGGAEDIGFRPDPEPDQDVATRPLQGQANKEPDFSGWRKSKPPSERRKRPSQRYEARAPGGFTASEMSTPSRAGASGRIQRTGRDSPVPQVRGKSAEYGPRVVVAIALVIALAGAYEWNQQRIVTGLRRAAADINARCPLQVGPTTTLTGLSVERGPVVIAQYSLDTMSNITPVENQRIQKNAGRYLTEHEDTKPFRKAWAAFELHYHTSDDQTFRNVIPAENYRFADDRKRN